MALIKWITLKQQSLLLCFGSRISKNTVICVGEWESVKILCNAVRQGSYHSGAGWKTMVVISSKTLCRGWECGNVSTFTACFQWAVVVTRVLICVERSCWPFLHSAVFWIITHSLFCFLLVASFRKSSNARLRLTLTSVWTSCVLWKKKG